MAPPYDSEDPYSSTGNNIFDDDLRDPLSSFTTPDKISPFFHDIEDTDPDVRPLSLPSGVYTLLPSIERCDNARLPQGPFGPFWHGRAREERKALKAERERLKKLKLDKESGKERDNEEDIDALLATLTLHGAADEEELVPFFVHEGDKKPIGFLRPPMVQALLKDNDKAVNKLKMEPCWKILAYTLPASSPASTTAAEDDKDESATIMTEDGLAIWGICINDWLNDEGKEGRTEHFDRLVRGWHQSGQFNEELKGWREEMYPIYGPELSPEDKAFNPLPGANHVFDIERAACSLFGFVTFGVHMTAYVRTEDEQYKIWVPKRAATKATWPGYLDNSVAGGITSGDSPLETLIKECAEEANLPPTFVRKRARPVGVCSYVYRNKYGWLQPEVEYLYDLEMPPPVEPKASSSTSTDKASKDDDQDLAVTSGAPESVTTPTEASTKKINKEEVPSVNAKGEPCILRPNDGEAESFSLMQTDEVLDNIIKNKFKANCALVMIDFFLRHGLITAETDSKYLEISQRLKGSLYPLPGPA